MERSAGRGRDRRDERRDDRRDERRDDRRDNRPGRRDDRGGHTPSAYDRRPGQSSSSSSYGSYSQPTPQSSYGGGGGGGAGGGGPGGYGPPPKYYRSQSDGQSVRAPAPRYGASGSSSMGPHGGGGDARGRGNRPSHALSTAATTTRAVLLQANYFKVITAKDWRLYQYHVDFDPVVEATVVRKGLLRLHKERLGTYMFDGTAMYTCAQIPGVTMDQTLVLMSERTTTHEQIKITVKYVGEMAKSDPHYLQLFNILMRKGLQHLKLQMVGRNFFDARAKVEIRQHGFELWPGYLTSIRQHQNDILMCVEITHKVMRQQTVLDLMDKIRVDSRGGDMQAACKAEIIGLTVLTDYNNNTYRVDDIDFHLNPQSTFNHGKGDKQVPKSYLNYYRERYGINIRNNTQPLLLSRSTARDRRAGKDEHIYLVPELCRPTGLTDTMRSDFRLMAAMAEHTRVKPAMRIEKLLGFNRRLMSEPNVEKDFNEWQMKLDRQLVDVPARVLGSEKIRFANSEVNAGENADWTMAFRSNHMFVSAPLNDWVLIYPNKLQRDMQNFIQMLQRAANGMGFNIGQPQLAPIADDRAHDYTHQLEEVMSRRNPQLVFCVSMRPRADVYSAIKKKCCLDRPVPSQVFLAKNLNSKGAMSIATKVAIQMNCKIGGAPWTIDVPLSGLMVVGFDVCHDPNQRGTDFGAMVASLDKGFTRYFSAVSRHAANEELANEFGMNMVRAVKKYYEVNKAYPKRIIIYRDGVGDGQIPFVVEHEIVNLRKALAKVYPSNEPVQLAFVLVTKRINSRFFLNRENPPPGTVIEDVVTDPNRYDFFIVSQTVRQGSVTPTAYNVLYDDTGLTPERLQILTYKLCHMYFNWSGTVRVPAPCQFSHKLAFLVSQSIHRAPSSHLETLLYFL